MSRATKNEVLALHLANLERCSAELHAQTERFRLANDRLETFLLYGSRQIIRPRVQR